MSSFEIVLFIASVVTTIVTILYMNRLVKVSGRDRPHDPERVQRFVETAPLDLLHVVLDDYEGQREVRNDAGHKKTPQPGG